MAEKKGEKYLSKCRMVVRHEGGYIRGNVYFWYEEDSNRLLHAEMKDEKKVVK